MNKLKVSSLKEGASLTLLIFIAIVSIVEVVGPFITSIQSSILSFLGSGVGSAAAGITVTAGKIIDTLTKQSITETALLGIGIIFILPAIPVNHCILYILRYCGNIAEREIYCV